MTETSPISHQSMADDDNEIRVSTVGKIHPHLQAKVVDVHRVKHCRSDRRVNVHTGYSVMRGYWRDPGATSAAIDARAGCIPAIWR